MLTVIGEALVDVVSREGEEPRAHVGGSPMNVAVGLARLGHDVQFLGRYGRDEYGRQVADHLTGNGVRLPFDADALPTSVAQATLDETGAASYDFQLDWSLDVSPERIDELLRDTDALHAGSIGAMLEPGATVVGQALERARGHALISYDPNCRPSIIPDSSDARARAEKIVALSHVIKASDEDLLWLYPHRSIEDSARAWLKAGARLVVVTRGVMGPWAVSRGTGRDGVEVPAARVTVADTVGAGDSFMAALLSGLADRNILGPTAASALDELDSAQLTELLRHAAAAAGVTVSRSGADLPTRADLIDHA
ncbi:MULTISPECIES: carbohydrate kinase family protein [Kocuria]|uniref:Ribokinase n=2 Tax=Kocuria marina TaxID=223184 RepID=A0A0B0DDV5_9MICC|nr:MULTISPECIES: carbohydrate kinase [Kocuria]KHE75593.1 ribokinase [Kocuria marina]MCG7432788.1 carbohydrate kinase [Kocuria indica]MCT1723500.1 carbohydrate kinase [Kocuria marina]MCT1735162.1 carbohydrate kinase [Kocuria marina]OXS78830.1 carbohydrate kinase [Kocuria indica]